MLSGLLMLSACSPGKPASKAAVRTGSGPAKLAIWPAGVDRIFMTRVTAITGHYAIIAACDDGSKFKQENSRTGRWARASCRPQGRRSSINGWRRHCLSPSLLIIYVGHRFPAIDSGTLSNAK